MICGSIGLKTPWTRQDLNTAPETSRRERSRLPHDHLQHLPADKLHTRHLDDLHHHLTPQTGQAGKWVHILPPSPCIKILERVILPTLTEHLPVPNIQHGFRSNHSTVTTLHKFLEAVAGGFNERNPADRTLLVHQTGDASKKPSY